MFNGTLFQTKYLPIRPVAFCLLAALFSSFAVTSGQETPDYWCNREFEMKRDGWNDQVVASALRWVGGMPPHSSTQSSFVTPGT